MRLGCLWSAATVSGCAQWTSIATPWLRWEQRFTSTVRGSLREGSLRGADIALRYPSVGATETVLLAAVLAQGRTILHNAAIEPEVEELVGLLQRMGAIIERADGRRYVIDGVASLQPSRQRTAGDRVEAFSYLVAGIATQGKVAVTGCDPSRMSPAIALLRRLGATVRIDVDGRIEAEDPRRAGPHSGLDCSLPGFRHGLAAPAGGCFDPGSGRVPRSMRRCSRTVSATRTSSVAWARQSRSSTTASAQATAGSPPDGTGTPRWWRDRPRSTAPKSPWKTSAPGSGSPSPRSWPQATVCCRGSTI